MKFTQFDPKTGITLQSQPPKTAEHCNLEFWLDRHGLTDAPMWTAKFYEGVGNLDRQRLEAEGKFLFAANGKNGYFTDAATARLITAGDADRGIAPLYAANANSPHNLTAYGSLITSDGIASTRITQARILVIDDQKRSHGDATLSDRSGKPIPAAELSKLYDKMCDGSMFVASSVLEALITPEEQDAIADRVFAKAGISGRLDAIAQEASQLDAATHQVTRQVTAAANRLVTQFRAASPDLPGMIKGTMSASAWCERLGVDAIVSTNCIKGDDKRLSTPGLHHLDFWVNRKSDAKYGNQTVGPQIKGCIPDATLHEFNPRMLQQAQKLAAIAADPEALLQHYCQKQQQHRERQQQNDRDTGLEADESADQLEDELEADLAAQRPQWLETVGQVDKFGLLAGLDKANRLLESFLRTTRVDHAVNGIEVPSAMAQGHAALMPWEVCNKDLPHGAIVAYLRSPFPNVGAAAIAINNTQALKEADPEAFRKSGVAFIPLVQDETGNQIALPIPITDFDKDANGYFVGYEATTADLPEQIREELAPTRSQPWDVQYEAGRSKFASLIEQLQSETEGPIKVGQYPLAVKEFIARNAPELKPPPIEKQPKVKHQWHESESHSAALWRAWSVTADNPTPQVANAGMTLQSFANECRYTPDAHKEALALHIGKAYQKLIKQVGKENLAIPSDEELSRKGFPAYHLVERITSIAQTPLKLQAVQEPALRASIVQHTLDETARLLDDVVAGPNAENLQTAVDTAKSSRGIDREVQALVEALSYKDHVLRQHQKDPTIYTQGQAMPTNTVEPIGWGVEQSNALYQETQLVNRPDVAFRDLFERSFTPAQEKRMLTIADQYERDITAIQTAERRLRDKAPSDRQPTATITSPSGRSLTIERLSAADREGIAPIWRTSEAQPNWEVSLSLNDSKPWSPEPVKASLVTTNAQGDRHSQLIGFVSQASNEKFQFDRWLRSHPKQELPISAPTITVHPPLVTSSRDELKQQRRDIEAKLEADLKTIPETERSDCASALWKHKTGKTIVLHHFLPELVERLKIIPAVTLRGLGQDVNEIGTLKAGEYDVRFRQHQYIDAKGSARTVPSIAVVVDGVEKQYGTIRDDSVVLRLGTMARATIQPADDHKTARMQISEVLELPSPETSEAGQYPDLKQTVELNPTQAEPPPEPAKNRTSPWQPTRGDLKLLYEAATQAGAPDTTIQEIVKLGQSLKACFNQETGTNDAFPPLHYSHPNVTGTEKLSSQLQQVKAALAQAFLSSEKPSIAIEH